MNPGHALRRRHPASRCGKQALRHPEKGHLLVSKILYDTFWYPVKYFHFLFSLAKSQSIRGSGNPLRKGRSPIRAEASKSSGSCARPAARVDEIFNRAWAAHPPPRRSADHGFASRRSFRHPDGHLWKFFIMDPGAGGLSSRRIGEDCKRPVHPKSRCKMRAQMVT